MFFSLSFSFLFLSEINNEMYPWVKIKKRKYPFCYYKYVIMLYKIVMFQVMYYVSEFLSICMRTDYVFSIV